MSSFDLESQSAGTITNVGGDHHVNVTTLPERRPRLGRTVVGVGLALTFGGLGFLVLTAVRTAQALLPMPPWPEAPYAQYLSHYWIPAVILLCCGVVVRRFGRIYAGGR